jgi:hypothetical protein
MGEGQDEGSNKNQSVIFSDPLTLTLSQRERGLCGTAVGYFSLAGVEFELFRSQMRTLASSLVVAR